MTDVRRILTGTVNGKSTGVDDRRCGFFPFVPGVELCELWHEAEPPVDLQSLVVDPPAFPLMTKAGQFAARIVRFLPHDETARGAENAALAAAGVPVNADGLHATPAFEYYVVRSGITHLRVERGETEVRAGDHVVLMGGFHAWENRSGQPVELVQVMLGTASIGEVATAPAGPVTARESSQPRRIIAGNGPDGRSAILIDAELFAPAPINSLAAIHGLWAEHNAPPANLFAGDTADTGLPPPPAAQGSSMWQVTVNPGAADNSVLRAHDTVDVIAITQGEVVYVSEGPDLTVRAGDVIIQKGNRHTWRNETDKPAVFTVVHVGVHTLAHV